MRLSVEILDHIFSFLVSHRETLIACSKDPVLSPIVERHLYHHVIVNFGGERTDSICTFEPERLSKLVSENPRILYYVRILQILVGVEVNLGRETRERLNRFSKTLLMFPVFECIMLTGPQYWYWPDVFRAALENCLNIPTVKELHLTGNLDFPLSFLENHCKNIKSLSLLGALNARSDDLDGVSTVTLPQLKSLDLSFPFLSSSLLAWLNLHITELQSLKCASDAVCQLSQLLGGCLNLKKLEVDLTDTVLLDYIGCEIPTGDFEATHFPKISLVPSNLQHLTIRTAVSLSYDGAKIPFYYASYLPATAQLVTLFVSLQHLVLDINITLLALSDLNEVDFSPLDDLGTASLSTPRIDLYVRTGISPAALTHDQLLSSLEGSKNITKLIEGGTLVIHPEESAPHWVHNR